MHKNVPAARAALDSAGNTPHYQGTDQVVSAARAGAAEGFIGMALTKAELLEADDRHREMRRGRGLKGGPAAGSQKKMVAASKAGKRTWQSNTPAAVLKRQAWVVELYRQGKSASQVGKELEQTTSAITRILRAYEARTGERVIRSPATDPKTLSIVERYRGGESAEAIAKDYGCRSQSIRSRINSYEAATGERILRAFTPKTRPGTLRTEAAERMEPNRGNGLAHPIEERAEAISIAGIVPLDEMLRIIARNRDNPEKEGLVLEACKAAAPYLHARLAPIEHSGRLSLEKILETLTREQLKEFAKVVSATLDGEAVEAELLPPVREAG